MGSLFKLNFIFILEYKKNLHLKYKFILMCTTKRNNVFTVLDILKIINVYTGEINSI